MQIVRFPIKLLWNTEKRKWNKLFIVKWKALRDKPPGDYSEGYSPTENPLQHIGKDVVAWAYVIPEGYALLDLDLKARPEQYGVTTRGQATLRGTHYLVPAWPGITNDAGRLLDVDIRTHEAGCGVWYGALPPILSECPPKIREAYTGRATPAYRQVQHGAQKHHHLVLDMARLARQGLPAEQIAALSREAADGHECEAWDTEARKAVEKFAPPPAPYFVPDEPTYQDWNESTAAELRLLLGRPLKGDPDYVPPSATPTGDRALELRKAVALVAAPRLSVSACPDEGHRDPVPVTPPFPVGDRKRIGERIQEDYRAAQLVLTESTSTALASNNPLHYNFLEIPHARFLYPRTASDRRQLMTEASGFLRKVGVALRSLGRAMKRLGAFTITRAFPHSKGVTVVVATHLSPAAFRTAVERRPMGDQWRYSGFVSPMLDASEPEAVRFLFQFIDKLNAHSDERMPRWFQEALSDGLIDMRLFRIYGATRTCPDPSYQLLTIKVPCSEEKGHLEQKEAGTLLLMSRFSNPHEQLREWKERRLRPKRPPLSVCYCGHYRSAHLTDHPTPNERPGKCHATCFPHDYRRLVPENEKSIHRVVGTRSLTTIPETSKKEKPSRMEHFRSTFNRLASHPDFPRSLLDRLRRDSRARLVPASHHNEPRGMGLDRYHAHHSLVPGLAPHPEDHKPPG